MENRRFLTLGIAAVTTGLVAYASAPQQVLASQVLANQKISATQGGFTGVLSDDFFGAAVGYLGDVDGDGVGDIAVGAHRDDDGGGDRGAVWILFLNTNGTVKAHQKISSTQGSFTGVLGDGDRFGISAAGLGDLDGDGVPDLAVGAIRDDDGGSDRGATWILFLNSDGSVKSHQKISSTQGGFTGALDNSDQFGRAVALGDIDGDTVVDLAVGAWFDDDGGTDRGAVWVLFLNTNGTVKSHQKISQTDGGFTGLLHKEDYFGTSVTTLGDLDGDGVCDLAVGAERDDDGGGNTGAVWILFLNSNGTVKSHQKISDLVGGFGGVIDDSDAFGSAVAGVADFNCDGIEDLMIGARGDDEGGIGRGAVWIVFLRQNGTVSGRAKIAQSRGGFSGTLQDNGEFGSACATIGDLDGDGREDIVVGNWFDDDGPSSNSGAVWVLFMNPDCTVPVALQSHDSRWTGDAVEVMWRLAGIEGDLGFTITRSQNDAPFRILHEPRIERSGDQFTFRDASALAGNAYAYRVTIVENGSIATSFETSVTTPRLAVALAQNVPNPFNPSTTIEFTLEEAAMVDLSIYDAAGRRVRTLASEYVGPGTHSRRWDGRSHRGEALPSGVYWYRLRTPDGALSRRAVLIR